MRVFLKILIFILGFLMIVFLGFYGYYNYRFNQNLNDKEFNEYMNEIQNTKNLTENFYEIYEKVNPKSLENNFFSSVTNGTECQCRNLARNIQPFVKSASLRNRFEHLTFEYFLTRKIEKMASQKQCLNQLAQNFDFVYGARGIENAAQYYFEKHLDNLSEQELETLVKMMRNPVLYNPKRKNE